MTASQLDAVVSATGHDRYRWLTSEANPDADQREGYRRIVAAKAEALAAPDVRPDLGDQLRLLKLARECPHREAAECGCNYGRCALDGRDKSVQDCLECVGGAR
ncbi:hypothetical protein [Paludisphaera sp.]|uniref:hypothetical protein n=1 Tax=Paludisphaera sp. TaxID=2017432 RepID=UPI00301D86B7